jgi:hypothetical protein
MNHTPGPWKFIPGNVLVAGKNGLHLGTFSESCGLGDAAEANKALIAAAPDLLDALYRALPFIEDCILDDCYKPGYVGKTLDVIKTAIQKAEKP